MKVEVDAKEQQMEEDVEGDEEEEVAVVLH